MKSKPIIEFEKLEINLFSQEIAPSLISENLLKECQIVPKQWKLIVPPKINTQIRFFEFERKRIQ